MAANYLALVDWAALGPVGKEESALKSSMLLASMEAAALSPFGPMGQGAAAMSVNCENGPVLIPTMVLNPATGQPDRLELGFCGRAEGVTYELAYAPSLTPPIYWQRVALIPPEQETYVHYDFRRRTGFYRFGKLPDYYVSANVGFPGDGSKDLPFQTIQEAIDQAPSGSVIKVLPGTYSGQNNVNLTFGAKSLVLVSERGWEQTTIDCEGSAHAFLFDNGLTNKIIGFTIANAVNGAVLCSQNSHPIFMNCAFIDNSGFQGGAISVFQAMASLVNCRFQENTASISGGAIWAQGSSGTRSAVYVVQCTFSNNERPFDSGTIHVASNAGVQIVNSIIWTATNLGTEIALSDTGAAKADFCDIRGGFAGPGAGNISVDPQLEPGDTLRLTSASPCIDQGIATCHLGEYWVTDYDMDGEARLDHAGQPNTYGTTDIGADEFVYRLQFPLQGAFSQVDEASGAVYLGSITVGNEQHAKMAVIDDEVRTSLFIYELDTAGQVIPANTVEVNILHPNPPTLTDPNCFGSDPAGLCNDEINDAEGITFDRDNGHLYVITSQTKRNRFRDVDHSPADPVLDPPSNDYDRRRNRIMRIQLDVQGANPSFNPVPNAAAPIRQVWESEHVLVPFNTDFDANNGLIAFIRQQLSTMGPPYTAIDRGSDVLVAWNSVNKFDAPQNGVSYRSGEAIQSPGGGMVVGNFALTVNALALQPDGKILVGGSFYDVNGVTQRRIVRLHPDGTLDQGFSSGAGPNDQVHAIAVQSDERILIGGAFTAVDGVTRNRFARLNSDGSLDTTFADGLLGANDTVYAIVLQTDEKILVGGAFTTVHGLSRLRVVRLLPNGSVDDQYGTLSINNTVYSLALQPSDGKLLLGGDFTLMGGTRWRVARRLLTGGFDGSFVNSSVNGTVRSILLQPDGSLVIAGDFTSVQSMVRNGIARLTSTGTLDATFGNALNGANGPVRAVARQSDGRLLIGGDFTTVNGIARNRMARLHTDGSLDTTFADGLTGPDMAVRAIGVQPDTGVLVGGDFREVNMVDIDGIARLQADGSMDTTFAPTLGGALTETQIQNGQVTLVNATPNSWNYFKIWTRDASGKYHDGPLAACFTDGVPRLFINEFLADSSASQGDWVEIYNPANVPLDMSNIPGGFGPLEFVIDDGPFAVPIGSIIPARGFYRFLRSGTPGANEVVLPGGFNLAGGGDNIRLQNSLPEPVDGYVYTRSQEEDISEGRAWNGGPRGRDPVTGVSRGAQFANGTPYVPTALRPGPPASNLASHKHFNATPHPDRTTIHLEWQEVGAVPAVWAHSPKQHDFHPVNVEAIAYRSATEMIIGLRSPLSMDRLSGNALYFHVNNVAAFLPNGVPWGPGSSLAGITGPWQLNLNNQGIRSIEWCPDGLRNAQDQPVQRYLIIGGPANGGPLEKEAFGEKFSLYAWDGSPGPGNIATPQLLIDNLGPYAVRPEGVDLIQIDGEWHVLFVEDRFMATGYGTRNSVRWPVDILGAVE